MDNIPDKADKKGILYIMIDGAAINTRKKDENGSSRRENKLGLVFILKYDNICHFVCNVNKVRILVRRLTLILASLIGENQRNQRTFFFSISLTC